MKVEGKNRADDTSLEHITPAMTASSALSPIISAIKSQLVSSKIVHLAGVARCEDLLLSHHSYKKNGLLHTLNGTQRNYATRKMRKNGRYFERQSTKSREHATWNSTRLSKKPPRESVFSPLPLCWRSPYLVVPGTQDVLCGITRQILLFHPGDNSSGPVNRYGGVLSGVDPLITRPFVRDSGNLWLFNSVWGVLPHADGFSSIVTRVRREPPIRQSRFADGVRSLSSVLL